MKKLLHCALVSLVLSAVGITRADDGVSANSIVVGQSTPLTGLAAALGQEMSAGIRAYFEKVNQDGGINGRKLELITLDDGYEPDRAEKNTKELIEQKKVFALIGYVGTPTSNAALPIFTKAGVPFIGPFTGAMSLREPFNRYVFNIRASYEDEAKAIVTQLNAFGASKIAVFYQDDAYGKTVLNAVIAAMKGRKEEPIITASVPRNSLDVEEAVQKIIKAAPTGVAMGCTYPACAALIKRITAARMQPAYLTVSFGGVSSETIDQRASASGLGIVQVMPYPWSEATSVVHEYHKSMAAAKLNNYSYPSIEGYIAAKVFVEGLRRAGANLTRDKFIDAMESLHPYDVGGMTVNFSNASHNGSVFTENTMVSSSGKIIR